MMALSTSLPAGTPGNPQSAYLGVPGQHARVVALQQTDQRDLVANGGAAQFLHGQVQAMREDAGMPPPDIATLLRIQEQAQDPENRNLRRALGV